MVLSLAPAHLYNVPGHAFRCVDGRSLGGAQLITSISTGIIADDNFIF